MAAPSQVGQVSLIMASNSTLTVYWDSPTISNGLITHYIITATPASTVGLDSPLGSVVTMTLNVRQPETVLLSVLSGLVPATTYSVVLTAYTSGGAGSGPAVLLQTGESGEYFVYKYHQLVYSLSFLMFQSTVYGFLLIQCTSICTLIMQQPETLLYLSFYVQFLLTFSLQ